MTAYTNSRYALQRSRFTLIQEAALQEDGEALNVTRELIIARLEMLENNWNKFQVEHESLCLLNSVDLEENSYFQERIYERCQAFYVYARAKLRKQSKDFDASSTNMRSISYEQGTANSMMPRNSLPRVSLPSFKGDYQSWRSFHDLFSSLIKDNPDLSPVEKMHYLRTCVTGEAARTINNLSISGENFNIAWNLLVTRYENKRSLISAQLDRLSNIKPLKNKSAQGLRALLTTLTETLAALNALGCAVQSWDPLLLHHLVKILDQDSREAWEVKLGSSTDYPTYTQFEEFLIGRTRAFENLALHTTVNNIPKFQNGGFQGKMVAKSAVHFAAPTQFNESKCPICEATHFLAKCEQYLAKTVQQRRDIIQRARLCFNCLGSHLAGKCMSSKRCIKCGQKHHTSIHEFNYKKITKGIGETKVISRDSIKQKADSEPQSKS